MLKVLWRLKTLLVSAYRVEAVGSEGLTMHLAAQSARNSPTVSEESFFFFSFFFFSFTPPDFSLLVSSHWNRVHSLTGLPNACFTYLFFLRSSWLVSIEPREEQRQQSVLTYRLHTQVSFSTKKTCLGFNSF